MVGFLSTNLDKYFKKDKIKINFQDLDNRDYIKQFKTIIIDTNWINTQEEVMKMVKQIRNISNAQIIVICFTDIDYLAFYQHRVFDFVRYFEVETLDEHINQLIKCPQTISYEALIYCLRSKFEFIHGFITVEHKCFTSTCIYNTFKRDLNDTTFIAPLASISSLKALDAGVDEVHLSGNINDWIMQIVNLEPKKYLVIDLGVVSEVNWTLFKILYQVLDNLFVVDTCNQLTRDSKYYSSIMDKLLTFKKAHLVQIPNWRNKLKYRQMIKEISEYKKIK